MHTIHNLKLMGGCQLPIRFRLRWLINMASCTTCAHRGKIKLAWIVNSFPTVPIGFAVRGFWADILGIPFSRSGLKSWPDGCFHKKG